MLYLMPKSIGDDAMLHRRQLEVVLDVAGGGVRKRQSRDSASQVAFRGGDFLHVVHAFHRGGGLGGGDGGLRSKLGGQAGAHRAEGAEVLGQGAGVDALDAEHRRAP